jgi:glycine oxidase
MSQSFDYAVIGNGVIGLSVALAISREQRGASVAVIGDPERPFGATAASGAMLGCFGEVTAASATSPIGLKKLSLSVAARALWPDWLDFIGPASAPIVTARETVVLLNTVGSQDVDGANFAAIRRTVVRAGEPFEDFAGEDVEWIDPDANARPLRALLLPGEGAVDSSALLEALTTSLERHQVALIPEHATSLRVRGGKADGVRLANSELSAGTVVVAVGAATDSLIQSVPELAYRVPRVISGWGLSVLVDTADGTAPPYVLRTPNRAFACGLHVLPRNATTVYVGATNDIAFSSRRDPTIAEINFLTSCAVRQVRRDLDGGDLRKIQVGNRPLAMDGWPMIGATSVAGLWIVTGTYRDGLHLSPLLASEIASRLAGREGQVDIDEFSPEREPISTLSRSEVIEEVVRHTLATGFEAPWHVDPDWPDVIGGLLRPSLGALLDELGSDYIPPPEILATLLKSSGNGAVARMRKYYETVYSAWH